MRSELSGDGFGHIYQGSVADAVAQCYQDPRIADIRAMVIGRFVLHYLLQGTALVLPVDGRPLSLLLLRSGECAGTDGGHLRESSAFDIGHQGAAEGGTCGDEPPPLHPQSGAVGSESRSDDGRESGSDLTSDRSSSEKDGGGLGACNDLRYACGVGLGHVGLQIPIPDMVQGIHAVSEDLRVEGLDLQSSEHYGEHPPFGHRSRSSEDLGAHRCDRPLRTRADGLYEHERPVGGGLVDVVALQHSRRQSVGVVPGTAAGAACGTGSSFASAHLTAFASLIMKSAAVDGLVISTFIPFLPSLTVLEETMAVLEPFSPTE